MSAVSPSSGRSALLREVVSFGLVGLVNTAVGYGTILALMALGLGPVLANAGGYALGICVSYLLNSRFTFARRNAPGGTTRVLRFGIAVAIAWLINLAVLQLALRAMAPAYAQGIAMIAYTLSFFLLSRSFVFAARKSPAP